MAFGFPDKSKLFPMQILVQHLSFLPTKIIRQEEVFPVPDVWCSVLQSLTLQAASQSYIFG